MCCKHCNPDGKPIKVKIAMPTAAQEAQFRAAMKRATEHARRLAERTL